MASIWIDEVLALERSYNSSTPVSLHHGLLLSSGALSSLDPRSRALRETLHDV